MDKILIKIYYILNKKLTFKYCEKFIKVTFNSDYNGLKGIYNKLSYKKNLSNLTNFKNAVKIYVFENVNISYLKIEREYEKDFYQIGIDNAFSGYGYIRFCRLREYAKAI